MKNKSYFHWYMNFIIGHHPHQLTQNFSGLDTTTI
jgi:hypothetical protein